MKRSAVTISRRMRWLLGAALVLLVLFVIAFPGRRSLMAVTLATGLGREGLQRRIDAIEVKAVQAAPLLDEERAFLHDFYRTLATGGRLSIVARQTGRMMDHYLDASGADYRLDAVIFTSNERVQKQAAVLRKRTQSAPCKEGTVFSSKTFYMPHRSNVDSVFGLYHGTLHVTQHERAGACVLHWRGEVPWVWPSYAQLRKKYGTPHGESFPLPNLASLLFGREHLLFVDNGLGHHLAEIGMAKSFLAFSEWSEGEW